ncbi:MAG: sugar ABC transporter permease [Methanomassiliicoccales archaeon]
MATINPIRTGSETSTKRVESTTALLFIIPLFIMMFVFIFFPVFFSFYISLYHYDPFFHSVYFVGLSNYISVLENHDFIFSILNVLYYTAVVVPIQTFLAFFFALLFNNKLPASRITRALVFLPAISSPVAFSIIFIWVFSPQGLVNSVLSHIDIFNIPHNENWFLSTTYAFPAVMAMNIFSTAPYFMVIYIAGLQAIPTQILEAAALDGVKSSWSKFRYIYFPMLRFTTTFVVILGLIGAIQLFDQVFVITSGGPAHATYVPLMFIYNRAFIYDALGEAAAASFVLFAVIMVITLTQRRFFKEMSWG